jgi:hypothetical protein
MSRLRLKENQNKINKFIFSYIIYLFLILINKKNISSRRKIENIQAVDK